jgi:hypothetical protein
MPHSVVEPGDGNLIIQIYGKPTTGGTVCQVNIGVLPFRFQKNHALQSIRTRRRSHKVLSLLSS